MSALSDAQKDFFRENGCLMAPGAVTPAELGALRRDREPDDRLCRRPDRPQRQVPPQLEGLVVRGERTGRARSKDFALELP
jgi:hypothetical protein